MCVCVSGVRKCSIILPTLPLARSLARPTRTSAQSTREILASLVDQFTLESGCRCFETPEALQEEQMRTGGLLHEHVLGVNS